MSKKSTRDKVIESTKEISKEVYTDLLKPTATAIGNIIALPFKAIDAALSPIKKWIDNKNMPAHKMGRQWKFKIDEVDDWIKSGASAD